MSATFGLLLEAPYMSRVKPMEKKRFFKISRGLLLDGQKSQ